MANNFKQSTEAVNAAANAVCALCNSGVLRIYEAPQAADADTVVGAQKLLAELTMNATAFAGAVAGVAAANAITKDSSANNTGTAGWFRVFKTGGTDPVYDGTVGTAACDLNLNTVSIVAAAEVQVSSLTYTQPKA